VLAWRSLPGSEVVTAGSVSFDAARGGRGTQVSVHLQYAPPAGKAGALVASLFGREPSQTVREDLRHFKQLLEAGEIPRATATHDSCIKVVMKPGGSPHLRHAHRLTLAADTYGEILATIEGPEKLAISKEPNEREHGSQQSDDGERPAEPDSSGNGDVAAEKAAATRCPLGLRVQCKRAAEYDPDAALAPPEGASVKR
jgi:hypothetical protein